MTILGVSDDVWMQAITLGGVLIAAIVNVVTMIIGYLTKKQVADAAVKREEVRVELLETNKQTDRKLETMAGTVQQIVEKHSEKSPPGNA